KTLVSYHHDRLGHERVPPPRLASELTPAEVQEDMVVVQDIPEANVDEGAGIACGGHGGEDVVVTGFWLGGGLLAGVVRSGELPDDMHGRDGCSSLRPHAGGGGRGGCFGGFVDTADTGGGGGGRGGCSGSFVDTAAESPRA
ncbi:hypothetical protein MUK42_08842, partial [Musa troglodytarum]